MAFTTTELQDVQHAMDAYIAAHRPPLEIRARLDLHYRVVDQSVEIYETSPHALKKGQTIEHSVAKARYLRAPNYWRIYWKRGNGNWFGYEPHPTARSVKEFLRVVEQDPHGCFNG